MTPDKTKTAARQASRVQALNDLARAAGWSGWSEYETAVKNGAVRITARQEAANNYTVQLDGPCPICGTGRNQHGECYQGHVVHERERESQNSVTEF
jgi:hypothetical protein